MRSDRHYGKKIMARTWPHWRESTVLSDVTPRALNNKIKFLNIFSHLKLCIDNAIHINISRIISQYHKIKKTSFTIGHIIAKNNTKTLP